MSSSSNMMEISPDDNGEEIELQVNEEEPDEHEEPGTASSEHEATSFIESSLQIQDHYSLKMPSSTLRLRAAATGRHDVASTTIHVYEHRNKQVLLEQDNDQIVVKNATNTAVFSIYAFRATYTMVALLMAGLMFVFCFQLVLYLFLDLAVATGYTTERQAEAWDFVGTMLSLPLFIHGLASAMLLAFSFVNETWGGGQAFVKPNLISCHATSTTKSVISEWIYFCVFLGIPVVIIAVTLFIGIDNWWEISALVWFLMVFCFYLVFCAAVFYYEARACLLLAKETIQQEEQDVDNGSEDADNGNRSDEGDKAQPSLWSLLCRIILIRQVHALSGVKSSKYLIHGAVSDTHDNDKQQVVQQTRDAYRDSSGLYSRFTALCTKCCVWLYMPLDPPMRLYTTEEILGTRSYVTSSSWSLDKIYCNQHQRSVMILGGPSALHPSQVQSSFACSLLGNILGMVLCIGVLVWLDFAIVSIIILAVLIAACMLPGIRASIVMFRLYQDVQAAQTTPQEHDQLGSDGMEYPEEGAGNNNDETSNDEGIQQVWESYRVTRATNRFCWVVFGIAVLLFFVWPFLTLYAIGNYATATVFVITAILSGLHWYLDPSVILREIGSLDTTGTMGKRSKEEEWQEKSRLSRIMGKIYQKRARNGWVIAMAFIVLVFFVMCVAAINEDEDNGSIPQDAVLLDDFKYDPQPHLPYPTCQLKQGLQIPLSGEAALIDYVFLSNLAYLDPSVTQTFLDGWFGEGNAIDEQEIVNDFKAVAKNGDSAVKYNFVTFPQAPDGFGVVTIRGSVQMIDWFVDAQLWSAAALAQLVRAILPLGYTLWTPILHSLVRAVTFVGQHSVNEVSHYKQTAEFVETLQESGEYATLHVTGQSLGGGLAIITGAQTGAPAIAVSGPNALLSRKTFDPTLSEDELNRLVLNIVPDRDPVPRVDDLANLYQRIECTGPQNSLWACHSALRSLCEVIYTCGTDTRPAICHCVTEFDYPEPIPTGTRSFEDACSTV